MEFSPDPSGSEADNAISRAPRGIRVAISSATRAASRGQYDQDPAFTLAGMTRFLLLRRSSAATGGAILKGEFGNSGAHTGSGDPRV